MMNTISHRYRDFGDPANPGAAVAMAATQEQELEDLQLAAFENGYQAGWEDAFKAQDASSGQVSSEIAQNLQDLTFTHREAFLKLSAAMQPLMTEIVHKMLPDLAHQVLGMHILHEISELMDRQAENAIEITVAPEDTEAVQKLLNDMVRVPFALRTDALLSKGQAYLRVNTTEHEINLRAVQSGIAEAIEAFYDQTDLEITDG